MEKIWHKHRDDEGIVTVTFDLPGEKVNKFNKQALFELEEILDSIQKAKAVLFRSGKAGTFIAGADLKTLEGAFDSPEAVQEIIDAGHRIFGKIERLPCPTIAIIDGVCLGGGLEMALACSHRIATDHPTTRIGLPETSLGIIPGWGGTQRLPRLVGLQVGLGLILAGKQLDAKKSYKIGLVDAILPRERLEEELPALIRRCMTKNKQKRTSFATSLLEGNLFGRKIIGTLAKRELLKKTKGHYPAPLKALQVIMEGYPLSLEKGLAAERNIFLTLVKEDLQIAKNLIHLFFGTEQLKKQLTPEAKPLSAVGVIGAGVMGGAIGWLASSEGNLVTIKDINWDMVSKGVAEVNDLYRQQKKFKHLTDDAINLMQHRVSWAVDYQGFENFDLVIEAATENLPLKKQIFSEIEAKVRSDAIIASNTSSLTIAAMSAGMKHPERFVGMHFFNPVNRMPLVEVVAGASSSKQAIDTAMRACLDWKKMPILVRDCPGFLVNRIFAIQANEVLLLFQEGVSKERLAKLMTQFGYPMEPFELADTVGNDVSYKVYKEFEKAYGERMKVPAILETMVEKKFFGKKVGRGFYIYEGKRRRENPEITNSGTCALSDLEILDRIHFGMLNEAARCLEEKIVESSKIVDLALVLGIGFPPFRGGIFAYAEARGLSQVVEKMKSMGPRFTPVPLLQEMAKKTW